jgi:hypothetical protein
VVSYFIPISLLVIAGFTLGVLVGRLAWGASKSEYVQAPAKSDELTEPAEQTERSDEPIAEPPEPPEPPDSDVGPTLDLTEPLEPEEDPTVEPTGSSPIDDQQAPDLPVWQMKEVRSRQRPFVTPSPQGGGNG